MSIEEINRKYSLFFIGRPNIERVKMSNKQILSDLKEIKKSVNDINKTVERLTEKVDLMMNSQINKETVAAAIREELNTARPGPEEHLYAVPITPGPGTPVTTPVEPIYAVPIITGPVYENCNVEK